MKTNKLIQAALCAGVVSISAAVQAQVNPAPLNYSNSISLITNGGGAPAGGTGLWGYAFGDYAYVAHGDSLGRGTKMQYKGLGAAGSQQGPNAFEIRRAYLGYNYNINSKFAAYVLMEYQGDYDVNANRTLYLKTFFFKWKNIFKGTDLKIGQQTTNSFANPYNSEALMGYRAIDKTIVDMHGVDGATDMGIMLDGKLLTHKCADSTQLPTIIGYSAMMGNNSANTPVPGFTNAGTATNTTTDVDKKYRFNVYCNTLNGALTIGLYTDYINYGNIPYAKSSVVRQSAQQTIKAYAAYNTKRFGLGTEWFTQSLTNGETKVYTPGNGTNDTTSAVQTGISVFAHGTLIQKKLNVFARYDMYTPDANYSYNKNETFTSRFTNIGGVSWKETFMSFGFDYSPTDDKKVHFMPNVWIYGINNGYGSDNMKSDNYMVYRVTFLYAF